MKYKRILSIYNSLNYTYSALVKNHPNGLELDWISTIDTPFDYNENDTEFEEKSIEQFKNQFEEIKDKVDEISIVFPSEMIMVSQFPISANTVENNIKALLQIEISKAYPKLDINDFEIKTYTLNQYSDNTQKIMCVIIPEIDIKRYEEFFGNYGKKIISTNISQISAINSFIYNYPELRQSLTAIVGIQGNFLDFSVIDKSEIIYYNLLSYQQESEIPQILTLEMKQVNTSIPSSIENGIYCYGEDLSNELFSEISESLSIHNIGIHKLNAFRMIRTSLGEREKEYCKKVSQIFPPVIGASFPLFFNSQTL